MMHDLKDLSRPSRTRKSPSSHPSPLTSLPPWKVSQYRVTAFLLKHVRRFYPVCNKSFLAHSHDSCFTWWRPAILKAFSSRKLRLPANLSKPKLKGLLVLKENGYWRERLFFNSSKIKSKSSLNRNCYIICILNFFFRKIWRLLGGSLPTATVWHGSATKSDGEA